MKLTHNALSMLLKAYRAVLKKSFIINTAAAISVTAILGMGSAYANTPDEYDPNSYDAIIDIEKLDSDYNKPIYVEDNSSFADSSIYINGDDSHFLQNNVAKGSVDKVYLSAQTITDIKFNPDNVTGTGINAILKQLEIISIITGNYIKNEGGEFNINHLIMENKPLSEGDLTNVGNALQGIIGIKNAYDKIEEDGTTAAVAEAIDKILPLFNKTYINVGNLEFRNNDPTYTGAQSFNIGTADVGPYSLLRVIQGSGYDPATSVNIDTLNLDNLSGVGLGVFGDTEAPDEITINTLNLSEGGQDFGYSALLSRDYNQVQIGTINITDNTLDLSGSLISTFGADLIGYLEKYGSNYKEILSFLEENVGFAPQADKALSKGVLFSTIFNKVITAEQFEHLKPILPILQAVEHGLVGQVQGVTLVGIDGNAVTVNMFAAEESKSGTSPEIILGNVGTDESPTALNVNFDKASLAEQDYYDPGEVTADSQVINPENAIVLKGKFSEGSSLNLHYTFGVNNDTEVKEVLDNLAGKVSNGWLAETTDIEGDAFDYTAGTNPYKDTYKNFTVNVDSFGLMDGYTADLVSTDTEEDLNDPDYQVDPSSVCIGELNTNIDSLLDPAVLSAMMWRTQMDNLVNRLGDLHEANAANGLWVRAYGGNQDFDDRNIDNNYYGIQIGYDHNMGYGWTLGSALSYTQGDADFDKGSSDAYAFDLAVYGTWLHESGFYTDLVAKFGVVNTDNSLNFHNLNISASDSANSTAFGLSAEVGFKYDVNDLFYIEPQAQLSYSHIGDADASYGPFTADYKDINMLIGRVGFRAGVNLPDDYGSVYLRANGLKDFNGDVDADLYFDNGAVHQSRSVSEEMDDAWYEVGLGTTLKFNDSFYVYAECMYADGGDVDAIYGNLGARLMF